MTQTILRALPTSILVLACVPAFARAQQPAFTSPGMVQSPTPPPPAAADDTGGDTGATGQTDRFDSAFNPAFSFVIDAVLDYLNTDDDAIDDGVGLELRILEFGAQAWVDPHAWAYFIGATDGEYVAVEEAAVLYMGLGGNTTIRAGRFFVDFGKQMQRHVHELRTLERPLVLRAYLGEEVAGDGLQYGSWAAVGDTTVVRWSVGTFASLVPEHGDEEDEDGGDLEVDVASQKDVDELNFTARLTALTDVGESGVLQFGASGRFIPEASVELNDSTQTGVESSVYGLDLTYGWTSDDALRKLTLGGEFLVNTGDTVALVDDMGTDDTSDDSLLGFDDDVETGWYAFADWNWDRKHAVGVQYSAAEVGDADQSELELYYTRAFSEFHRLRLVASNFDSDTQDGDSYRFALQYTVTVGAHGHGLDW